MFLLSFSSFIVFAISISPPRFVIEVLPDSVLEKTVTLSSLEHDSEIMYVSIEGEAREWISHPLQMHIPKNKEKFESILNIQIPNEVSPGNYSARVNYLIPGEKNVDAAFSVPVLLIVTNKAHTGYAIRDLKAIQKKNLSLSFTLYNNGNADFGPAVAEVKVLDNLRKSMVYEGKKNIAAISAFRTESVLIDFGTSLPRGNYWIDFSIPMYGYKETVFLEADKITQTIQNSPADSSISSSIPAFFAAIIILLVLAVYLLKKRLKKKEQ